jgi:hypothetical protein
MKELPVSDVMAHMLRSTFNNLNFALHAQWPWALILALAIVLPQQLLGIEPISIEPGTEPDPAEFSKVFAWGLLVVGVAALGFSSAAVNWHRYILLDEVPVGMQKLRVDQTVWRYFGNLVLIILMASLCILPFTLLFSLFAGASFTLAFFIMMVAAVFILMPIIYRLSVKLPSIAIGRSDFSLNDAWKVTDGNWMRFVGIGLLTTILSWIAGIGVLGVSMVVNTMLGSDASFWVDLVLQVVTNWVLTIMGVTLLTSLYGFFVEGREF